MGNRRSDSGAMSVFPHSAEQESVGQGGLTLREYFAGQALQGYLASMGGVDAPQAAKWAVDYADALVRELDQ